MLNPAGMAQQQYKIIEFKTVQLLKDQILGIGSYGKVCKAKCDDLSCAAKLIHETLFDPTSQQLIVSQREHRLPMRRFEQECEFLSTIRHPHIVLYLGIYEDPDNGLPALLMELMDSSLTHFLESSPQPVPYHVEVNICHNISLALSFLHSNNIIHRDLSSNNVLLIGNVRAKVTDFGMARLHDLNPRETRPTFTICPGTDVYMPPEAVREDPVYTEKIDCFSFGVIIIQMLSRQFPKPSNRKKQVPISLPGLPSDTMAEISIPETARRQNHISTIDPNLPLLQVALDCLQDRDVERPSAQQLCERIAALKEDPRYSESVRVGQTVSTTEQGESDDRDGELRSQRQQCNEEVEALQHVIQSQLSMLAEKDETIDQTIIQKDQALRQKDEIIAAGQQQLKEQINECYQLEMEKNQLIEDKGRLERQLGNVNQQLEEREQTIAKFQKQIAELERLQQRSTANTSPGLKRQSSGTGNIKPVLTWREGDKALHEISCYYNNVAVDCSTLYILCSNNIIVYSYTISTCKWSQLPNSPTYNCPIVIVNNHLTLVGGDTSFIHHDITNQLHSFTGEGSDSRWTKIFPPMPTKRYKSTALCIGTVLIVAGGTTENLSSLKTIEVMSIETEQWSTAADLPKPQSYAPAAICGEHIYILGESVMYTCSITTLILSCKSFLARLRNYRDTGVWKEIAIPPVNNTVCVSIYDRLLTIGGRDSDKQPTAAIHMYDPAIDSWEVISHMAIPRWNCIAAVLPNMQLMVVGGKTSKVGCDINTDSVEIATIEQTQ